MQTALDLKSDGNLLDDTISRKGGLFLHFFLVQALAKCELESTFRECWNIEGPGASCYPRLV